MGTITSSTYKPPQSNSQEVFLHLYTIYHLYH
ncbi:hypothetical protein VP249E411_P0139 [Vibrio phage 249E41-1]|nr:hypothetical protein VP249E411_P0139 [Vibrio phage 249E41-1]CAH9017130.1 hypothetical protein VP193E371_P0137 [Vibrio phage 193E37-1]